MAAAQAELKKAQEIAKTMKKNKVDAELISKFTGLTIGEIEKL